MGGDFLDMIGGNCWKFWFQGVLRKANTCHLHNRTKQRGKGAPKKKRTKEESKKFAGKKKKQAAVEAGKDSSF